MPAARFYEPPSRKLISAQFIKILADLDLQGETAGFADVQHDAYRVASGALISPRAALFTAIFPCLFLPKSIALYARSSS